MARFDKSWRTRVNSMFTPLPIKEMANKIDNEQSQHDYYSSLLNGDYDPIYSHLLVDPAKVRQKIYNYKTDLSKLRDSLDNSVNFDDIAQNIGKIQSKYGITNGNGINYTQTNNNGTKNNNSTKNYNAKGKFSFNSVEGTNERNYNNINKGIQFYNKYNSPDSNAYAWYYIYRPAEEQKQKTNGEFGAQTDFDVKTPSPFDYQKFVSEITSMTKGYNSFGTSNIIDAKKYMYIANREYIDYSRVHGDKRSGTFGYILSNPEWNQHEKILYDYGTEKTGSINYRQYANSYLYNQAYNNLIANNPKGHKITDSEILAKEKEIEQNDIKAIKSGNNNITDDQAREYIEKNIYGLQGYKDEQADLLADMQAKREEKDIIKKTNLKLNYNGQRGLIKYKYDLTNGTATSGATSSIDLIDPKKKKKAIKQLFDGEDFSKDVVTDANTRLNNGLNNIFTPNDNYDPLNPLSVMEEQFKTDTELSLATSSGLLTTNSNGDYVLQNPQNKNALEMWRAITGNKDLTSDDLITQVTHLNLLKHNLQSAQNEYNTTQYVARSFRNRWAFSNSGKNFANDLVGKKLNIDGSVGYFTVIQIQNAISDNKKIFTVGGNTMNADPYNISSEDNLLTPVNYDDKISTDLSNEPTGDSYINIYNWNNRKSMQFNTLKANQNVVSTSLNDGALYDFNGKNITQEMGIKDPSNYTFSTTINPITTGDGSKYIQIQIKATGKSKNDKNKGIIKNKTVLVNLDNGSGLSQNLENGISTGLVTVATNNISMLKNTQNINQDSNSQQLGINYQILGTYDKNINRKALFNSNSDVIASINTNGKIGDKTPNVYNSNGVEIFYVKVKYGMKMKYKNNGKIYDSSYPIITKSSDAEKQIGQVIYESNQNNTMFIKKSSTKVVPIQ